MEGIRMKYIVAAATLATLSGLAQANGYVGLNLGRGKTPIDCPSRADACKDKVNVFKLYAGTRLGAARQMDLGVARLDGIEVAYTRVKEASSSTTDPAQVLALIENEFGDLENVVQNTTVPFKQKLTLDALTIAPVLRAQVMEGFHLFAKPGLAVVTTTLDSERNAQSQRSDSSTKIKPYLSLGLEYEVLKGISVLGAVDWIGYKVRDQRGTHRSVNLGAQVSF